MLASRTQIASCITGYLREHLDVPAEAIERNASFSEIGLSSLQLVGLTSHLSEELGRTLSPTLGWEYRTILELAAYLSGETGARTEPRHRNDDPWAEEQIAIIGMSCRFPGARDLESFWNVCWSGLDSITEVPSTRWDAARYYDPDPATPGKTYSRWGGFLEDLDKFDAAFFKISPREAVHLDPRQRLIMETSWEALENAGIPPLDLAGGNTGVFISTLSDDYGRLVFAEPERIEPYSGTGTAHSVIANRLSYFLDLHGPSLTIDTACSGALVALHLACRSLRTKECDLALTGGVNVILTPDSTLFFSRAGALSPQGRCKTFDSSADGFVRSEGAGTIVLKRLTDARRDKDRIYAVICGSAVNQDGKTNGMMAPSVTAQESVLRQAYANAGVSPGAVQYVELHGTGTRLGDPIEAEALGRVLCDGRSGTLPCLVGSVKSNIGHTEAAAGLAGVIKTALAIERRALPRSIHFTEINPLIPIESLPFRVAAQSGEWPDASRRIFAGISSFGFGGTNAHVVLGAVPVEQPPQASADADNPAVPLFVSAQSVDALRSLASKYADYLSAANAPYALVARCAAEQRSALNERLSVHVSSSKEAVEELRLFARDGRAPRTIAGSVPTRPQRLAFVYSGQGSHWAGMGRGLMAWEAFADTMRECDVLCERYAGFSLLSEIFESGARSRLDRTDVAQMAIFAVQASLTDLLRSFGIRPSVVIGQSLGEVAAAHACGALSLADAFLVVFERGRLMRRVEGNGRTAQVGLRPDQVRKLLVPWRDTVCIAGSSSPQSTVVAGDTQSIKNLVAHLEQKGIFARLLRGVEVAFHSSHMDSLREPLVDSLKGITRKTAEIPYFSTVDRDYRHGMSLDAAYWGQNLRQPFEFSGSIAALLDEGVSAFVELAPHAVLGSSIAECSAERANECIVIPTLRRGQEDSPVAAEVCGRLFLLGFAPRPFPPAQRRVLSLPTYQWQRDRYWIENEAGAEKKRAVHHPFLGECVHVSTTPYPHVWEIDLAENSPRFLSDHKVFGKTVFPGSGYIEMALAALSQLHPGSNVVLSHIEFSKGIVIPAGGRVRVQTIVVPQKSEAGRFEISSSSAERGASFALCASGRFAIQPPSGCPARDVKEIAARCTRAVSAEHHYRTMSERGLDYGPAFAALREIAIGSGEALARIELADTIVSQLDKYRLHPACLDALFQLSAPLLGDDGATSYLPVGVNRIELFAHGPIRPAWARVTSLEGTLGDGVITSDLELLDAAGAVVSRVERMMLRRVDAPQPGEVAMDVAQVLYEHAWNEAPLRSPDPKPIEQEPLRVCITSANSVARALCSIWSERGVPFVTVSPGPRYAKSEGGYTIRPDRAEDYRSLLQDLGGKGQPPAIAVVGLFAMDERFQTEGSEELLALWTLAMMQGVGAHQGSCSVCLVTRGAQAVAGSAVSSDGINQALVWGLGRAAFHFEHATWRGRMVDLDPQGMDPHGDAMSIEAALSHVDAEDQIAVRSGIRYAARLRPIADTHRTCLPLSADGAYLISGGLGVLGILVAGWLADRGARNIVLLGRTPLPPRTDWRKLAPDHHQQNVVRAIRAIEAKGCHVDVVRLDVQNLAALRAYKDLRESEERAPIRGIVHAAGVLQNSQIAKATCDDVAAVIGPKIRGARDLWRVFGSDSIDFVVFFSSLAGILPVVGQGVYGAANAFLDAFANHLQGSGVPAISIDWGPWNAGMMAEAGLAEFHASRGMYPLEPSICLEALDRIVSDTRPQWVVAAADWPTVRKTYPLAPPVLRDLDLAAGVGAGCEQSAEDLPFATRFEQGSTDERERLAFIELSELIAAVFRMTPERLIADQPLTAYGLDSMMATEIKNRLEMRMGLKISAVDLLKGITPARLATLAVTQLERKLMVSLPGDFLDAGEDQLEQALLEVEGMTDTELKDAL